MKKYVIIVAGGKGLRMGSDLPKQFLPMGDKPVLMHTLEVFRRYDEALQIILVLPQEQQSFWKQLCDEHHFTVKHVLAEGGETRFHSVKNGLALVQEPGLVGVHDGVRPFVSVEVIRRCYELAEVQKAVIPVVDVMKVSEEELLLLTEEPDYEKAALKILKQGPRIVAVTLGEKGAMIATQQHCETVKATPIEKIIDTTGAGDCFWGGFLSKYLKYGKGIEVLSWEEIMQCAVMGNSVAGLCVQKRGGIPSVPNKEELSDIWSA